MNSVHLLCVAMEAMLVWHQMECSILNVKMEEMQEQ